MNIHKKLLSILLMLVILVNPFTIILTKANDLSGDSPYVYGDGMCADKSYSTVQDDYISKADNAGDWNIIKAQLGIPEATSYRNVNNYPFNFEIWFEQHLTVYGDYTSLNQSEDNDFSYGRQVNGVHEDVKGYYINKNGESGEYRFHGFTYEGAKYANNYFKYDADSKRPAELKSWIYDPWLNAVINSIEIKSSIYNNIAKNSNNRYDLKQVAQVQSWLKLNFPLLKTINQNGTTIDKVKYKDESWDSVANKVIDHIDAPNKNIPSDYWDYFAVQTAPTLDYYGEVVGAQRYEKTGKDYYQIFSIDPIKVKLQPDVTTDIKILDVNYNEYNMANPIVFNGQPSVDLIVKVNITLHDSAYIHTEENKTMYYTRYDVKDGTFYKFTADYFGTFDSKALKPFKRDYSDMAANTDYQETAYFQLSFPNDDFTNAFQQLKFTVDDHFIYKNDEISRNANGSATTAQVTVPIKNDLICDFNINDNINVEKGQAVTGDMIGYSDASKGEIKHYSVQMVHYPDSVEKDVMNESAKADINSYLAGKINSELMYIDANKVTTLTFNVNQKVTSKAGEEKECTKTVTVHLSPKKTDFDLARNINMFYGAALDYNELSYKDRSIGRFVNYKITIKNDKDNVTSAPLSLTKNPDALLSNADTIRVEQFLQSFIEPYIDSIPEGTPITSLNFTVIQTAQTEAGQAVSASKYLNVLVTFKGSFNSMFNINDYINASESRTVSASNFGYRNLSIGDIGKYEFEIHSLEDGDSYFFEMNTVNESTVNSRIADFVQPYLDNLPPEKVTALKFALYQTAINKYDSSKTDSCFAEFYVNVGLEPVVIPPPPVYTEPNVNIPRDALDLIGMTASDSTDMSTVASKQVFVDGIEIPYNTFFSGNYIWGDNKDGLRNVRVRYISIDGYEAIFSSYVMVHDTKPQAQFKVTGTYKANRALMIENTSYYADAYVRSLAANPVYSNKLAIKVLNWNDYNTPNVRYRTNNNYVKELLYKQPGHYQYALTISNNLRPDNVTYNLSFQVLEDNKPTINLNIWNYMLSRNEDMKLTYAAVSVDEDIISVEAMDIYYDKLNDGTYAEHVGTYTPAEFESYKAARLGKYKVIAYAKESFGQPTFNEFITESDYTTTVLERDFMVDNLAPNTTISVNVPMILPKVDAFIMLDQSLTDAKTTLVNNNRINTSNYLRNKGLIPTYNIWDLHTYTYSTSASTTRHTGTSYPSGSTSYSAGGYSGTLSRTSVIDNGGYQDLGRYVSTTESQTFTDSVDTSYRTYGTTIPYTSNGPTISNPAPSSKSINSNGYVGSIPKSSTSTISDTGVVYQGAPTASQSFYKTWSNTGTINYNEDGTQAGPASWSSPAPSSYTINQNGYSGNIPRTGTIDGTWRVVSRWPNGNPKKETATFKAVYEGTLTKNINQGWYRTIVKRTYYSGTLTKTVQTWEPDIQWVSDYTGYYSGTIYKDVKQDYFSPFRVDANRYVIYVTDNNINNISDLNTVRNNNNVNVILIGSDTAKSQIAYSHFIRNSGSDINILINQAMDWIAAQNPQTIETYTVLPGYSFNISTANFDEENDTIISDEFLYIHDASYYDNSQGQEADTVPAYDKTTGWTSIKLDTFTKPGAYTVYHRIKDQASLDPSFAAYNKTSNEPYFKINVHRKPIALADMSWKYDPVTSLYKLTFIDKSYDLDHSVSRQDKGIVEAMIRFRKDSGIWNYMMPTDLTAGTYTIEYYVKDMEETWSDAYVLNTTLDTIPVADITIDSTIQFKDPILRNDATIPAGEVIQIVSNDKATGPVIHSNVPVTTAEVYINGVKQSSLTLTQIPSNTEYLYQTNISEYQIPANHADGNINVRIHAATSINNQSANASHTVQIYTPIWEDYSNGRLSMIDSPLSGISASMMLCDSIEFDRDNTLTIKTSKYTDKIEIKIDQITFYMFADGKLSRGIDGAAKSDMIASTSGPQRYKVYEPMVAEAGCDRSWSFKLCAVEGYPILDEEQFDISITGYDTSGNWDTTDNKHHTNPQIMTSKAQCYLLESFRVTKVRDLHLESYYYNPTTAQYDDKPMYASDMAIDYRNFIIGGSPMVSGLTKGYSFEFQIDSSGFNDPYDTIEITPHFYIYYDTRRENDEKELYWEDSKHQIYKAGEGGHAKWAKLILRASDRTITDTTKATWKGSYLIPATAWAVPLGTPPDQAKEKDLKKNILVNFQIKGYKNGELKFDYNQTQWPKERTQAKAPFETGDVIAYDWDKSCLEDKKVIRNR